MRKLLVAISTTLALTAIFAASPPNAAANPNDGHHGPLACIGNGHSCTHDDNCCSGKCVNRTCK
jgi:hypothetical protein